MPISRWLLRTTRLLMIFITIPLLASCESINEMGSSIMDVFSSAPPQNMPQDAPLNTIKNTPQNTYRGDTPVLLNEPQRLTQRLSMSGNAQAGANKAFGTGNETSSKELLIGIDTKLNGIVQRTDRIIELMKGDSPRTTKPVSRSAKPSAPTRLSAGAQRPRKIKSRLYGVQIGAYKSKARAVKAWEYTFSIAAADLLSGQKLHYQNYQPPGRRSKLVRIIIGEYKSAKAARKKCAEFKNRDLDCVVVSLK